jgi:hypothetical protein
MIQACSMHTLRRSMPNRPKRRCRLWAIRHHFPMDEKVLRVGSDPIHLILSILSFISTLAEGFFAPCLL